MRLLDLVLTRNDEGNSSSVVRGWALEVNAGAKYWRNDLTLDFSLAIGDDPPLIADSFLTEQSWWDPMIGVKAN